MTICIIFIGCGESYTYNLCTSLKMEWNGNYLGDYLGWSGILLLSGHLFHQYGSVIFMRASVTHLWKLDSVQQAAERKCQVTFPLLSSRQKASAIGLLCKLLDGQCRGPLQNFCPHISYLCHTYLSPVTCY